MNGVTEQCSLVKMVMNQQSNATIKDSPAKHYHRLSLANDMPKHT